MHNTVLFDNWSLFYSNWALFQVPSHDNPSTKRTNPSCMNIGTTNYNGITVYEDWIGVMALANLLESLVLYDKVLYPSQSSDSWRDRADGLEPILSYLHEMKIEDTQHEEIQIAAEEIVSSLFQKGIYEDIITVGAMYYLLLSIHQTVPCQLTPKRSDFLAILQAGQESKIFAQKHLINYFDKESLKICSEIQEKINFKQKAARIPAVASYIFHNVQRIDEIVPLLIEIRQSKERHALVNWLNRMNLYLENGNISAYTKEFNGVCDLFDDLRVSLGLRDTNTGNVAFGLSPSLNLNFSFFKRIFRSNKPHLNLIKKFRDHLFTSRTYAMDVNRLFGIKSTYYYNIMTQIEKQIRP